MFEILDVKRANYYKWLKHSKSERDLKNEELADLVRKYDEKFNHTLGYRMMTDRINRDENKNYNDKQVYKVMKILGIKSIIRPKRRSCTVRKSNNTAKNNLERDFNASRPNEKWVTDVTEFKYGKNNENKLYLSLILDLYDRYPVGYEISDHNNNELVFNTFRTAVDANPGAHPLFHSDGGFQYTSPVFVRMLKDNGMEQSMSRVHCCIDNGPMEGFWGILKCEIYHYGKKYETREELEPSSRVSGSEIISTNSKNSYNGKREKLEEEIKEWIRYYSDERYQRRFGVKTPYEVRSEALCNENPVQYPIPENKAIQKYKATHYA